MLRVEAQKSFYVRRAVKWLANKIANHRVISHAIIPGVSGVLAGVAGKELTPRIIDSLPVKTIGAMPYSMQTALIFGVTVVTGLEVASLVLGSERLRNIQVPPNISDIRKFARSLKKASKIFKGDDQYGSIRKDLILGLREKDYSKVYTALNGVKDIFGKVEVFKRALVAAEQLCKLQPVIQLYNLLKQLENSLPGRKETYDLFKKIFEHPAFFMLSEYEIGRAEKSFDKKAYKAPLPLGVTYKEITGLREKIMGARGALLYARAKIAAEQLAEWASQDVEHLKAKPVDDLYEILDKSSSLEPNFWNVIEILALNNRGGFENMSQEKKERVRDILNKLIDAGVYTSNLTAEKIDRIKATVKEIVPLPIEHLPEILRKKE